MEYSSKKPLKTEFKLGNAVKLLFYIGPSVQDWFRVIIVHPTFVDQVLELDESDLCLVSFNIND